MEQILITVRTTLDELLRLRWNELQFGEARNALLLFTVLAGVAIVTLLLRYALTRRRSGDASARSAAAQAGAAVVLPAIVPGMRRSAWSIVRYLPMLVFLAGVPFFALAIADPHTGFAQEDVSYPGRRIALLVDASTSMVMSFGTQKMKTQGESAFFTAVSAAETFMKRRMNGPYHDLISLIQFGNEAYVVTPFTTDYENVLLSVRLVGDPKEWGRFSDWGTTIIEGIDQALQLFKSFDFLNASGNLMIVITDGRDSELNRMNRPLEAIVNEARRSHIPVYMIRVAYKMPFGKVLQDTIWQPIVERTGGRFYAAPDEESILNAIKEIDRLTPGKIEVRQYSVQRPRYAGFALIAVALWSIAAAMKLGFSTFRSFP
ncbi:MAG TPA: vWA domain-containing protein [Vicinamibacterales bacterium]|nr:vWA domain-containing protein [Vicinamibacterales bacterium]